MSDILDRSLKVVFNENIYVLNFKMKNILQYEKNTNRGVFGDVDSFFSFKFNYLIDLLACMLEDEKGTILSDFVYGLSDEKKVSLIAELSTLCLTCFSENIWSEKEEKEDKKKD